MSGFEIVGVVLGALPLIITAFENLHSFADKLNLLTNFNSEHREVWNKVKDEETMYRMQLRILLTPLVRDGDLTQAQLETLLSNPNSDAWREAALGTALKKRLGESYDRYLSNVEEIQNLAWRLMQPLAQRSAFKKRTDDVVRDL
jgi:hypothetical protein